MPAPFFWRGRKMTQTPTLAAALALASIGIHVFPCRARAKTPATLHGCLDATVDPAKIEAWWQAEPNLNLAAATGPLSGIFIVDVDGAEAEVALRNLEAEHSDLPDTATTFTARGRHLWLEHPDGACIRNSASKLAPGIDVRAAGGFVLVPPSLHPSGKRYRWGEGETTIAAAPDWLIEKISAPASASAAATPPDEWADLIAAGVDEGARNCTLARLAGHLLRHRIDPYVALELLQVWNQARCRPPLPDAAVERIVGSISARELRRRDDA
jgi:Bifunctional DNA primase/polymerase, N-terminal/Primase C terminal 1 (PriCT-1)